MGHQRSSSSTASTFFNPLPPSFVSHTPPLRSEYDHPQALYRFSSILDLSLSLSLYTTPNYDNETACLVR